MQPSVSQFAIEHPKPLRAKIANCDTPLERRRKRHEIPPKTQVFPTSNRLSATEKIVKKLVFLTGSKTKEARYKSPHPKAPFQM
jgi:hypothetical protein